MKQKLYVLIVLLLGVVSVSFAQKGRYHVRFTVKSIDCSTAKVVIRVEVKASKADSTFLMGDANYRFDYDSRVIKNPQIISQENFSSIAPASDSRYNPQTLNGSTAGPTIGTVSLNTIYGGSGKGAKQVGTDWITVSCIGFDIINTQLVQSNCFGLTWHTDTTFPITGLNEIVLKKTNNSFDYDSETAKPGGVFESLKIASLVDICSGTQATADGELMIPEGFSPNGDGSNDKFEIRNLGSLKAELTVFDRNGSVIYEDSDYQNDWMGRDKHGDLPVGTYFYSVRLSDGRKFTHSLTISR